MVSGTDQPQYGERASDEDQARARARYDREPTPTSSSPPMPSPPVAHQVRPGRRPRNHNTVTGPNSGVPSRASVLDRFATVFLLAFGLVYLIGGAPSYLDLSVAMDAVTTRLGIGDYTPTSVTSVIGIVTLVCQVVIWLATTAWCFRRLSRGQLSWWVPVVGAVVSFLVSAILLGVLLASDPAVMTHFAQS